MWMRLYKKCFFIVILAISALCLSGCFYTKEDITEYTKGRLEEEYGEKFEIKTVVDGNETSAYPVNNPNLLFKTWYVMSNGNGYNSYKEEIIANYYKTLIAEKLVDFQHDYCINVDVKWQNGLENMMPDDVVEQYLKENIASNVKCYVYLSSSALELDDADIFKKINEIVKIPEQGNCYVSIWFLPENELSSVKKSYERYSYLIGQLYIDILDKYPHIWQGAENGTVKNEFEDIQVQLQEVRNNELYG